MYYPLKQFLVCSARKKGLSLPSDPSERKPRKLGGRAGIAATAKLRVPAVPNYCPEGQIESRKKQFTEGLFPTDTRDRDALSCGLGTGWVRCRSNLRYRLL